MSIETTNTGSTVDVTYGSMCGRMGYHFDFGDHVEYISFWTSARLSCESLN